MASIAPMTGKGTTRRSIRVDDETWEAAQSVSKERDENLSEVVRARLIEYAEENAWPPTR